MDSVIRPAQMIGQRSFTSADNIPTQRLRRAIHEIFKRPPQLILWFSRSQLRHFGRDAIGESLEGVLQSHFASHEYEIPLDPSALYQKGRTNRGGQVV